MTSELTRVPNESSTNLESSVLEPKRYRTDFYNDAIEAMDTGHTIDWKNTQVKADMPYFWQRCTLETRHMRSQPHPLNREEGILPHMYDALIRPNTPLPRVPEQTATQN